jgi:porin
MIAAALALTLLAAADDDALLMRGGGHAHSHTHAVDEIDESHGSFLLETTYTAESMANVSGGQRRGARYLDNLDVVFEADLGAAAGWDGAQLHLYGLYNNGRSISALVGDTQAVSNIETGTRAVRLYEAWIDQKIGSALSLRAGLYDLNSEFDALETSGLLLGSAHGIGTDISQTGRNGPSIFPSTSLAARIEVKPAKAWVIRAAVLDGVPGDPDHPGRMTIRLGNGDGAFMIGEVEAPVAGGRLLIGHWRYTAAFDAHDGRRGHGNAGFYVRGEAPLIQRNGREMAGFFRLGTARGRYNMFDRFVSAGVKLSGFVPGRKNDDIGFGFAAAFTSRGYRLANGGGSSEVVGELTYRAQLASWFALQPNVQYIRSPSADPARGDALVLGLRGEVSFRWTR